MKKLRKYAIGLSAMVLLVASVLMGSDHQGLVRIGEVPVPGASVQAIQGEKTLRVVTDGEGRYSIPDLSDGMWTIQVEMPATFAIDPPILGRTRRQAREVRMRPPPDSRNGHGELQSRRAAHRKKC